MHPDQSVVASSIDGGLPLAFEAGHEYAPDSPMGLVRLELAPDGTFTYKRSRAGQVLRTGEGAIAAERAQAVFADLARSSFPDVPAHLFPPGASVVTISMLPDRQVALDYYFGLDLDGYREALTELMEIVSEARASVEAVADASAAAVRENPP